MLCLLSGLGGRFEAELDPDKPVFERKQRWQRRGSGLVFGQNGKDGEDGGDRVITGEVPH